MKRVRSPFVLATSLVSVLAACARPPAPGERAAPLETIDLAPRCLEVPDLPPLSNDDPSTGPRPLARRFTFPDGPSIWLDDAPAAPLARIAIAVPWPREEADDAAIAGLLLSEGWTARDPAGFRGRAARRGARIRVDTEGDHLWLSLSAPATEATRLTELLDELLALAPIEDETFEGLRRRARLARLATSGLPSAVARDRLDRLLLGDRASKGPKPARANAALVETLRTRLLEDTERQMLVQGLDASRLASLSEPIRDRLGSTAGRSAANAPVAPVAPDGSARPERDPDEVLVVDRSGAPQVEILVAIPNAPGHPEDEPLLEVLASAVGGNVGGRLFADLRERRGLVYTIDATQDPEGLFVVTTRARASRVPAVIAGVEAHLRALVDVPFLACEVTRLAQRMHGEALLEGADAESRYASLRARLAGGQGVDEHAVGADPPPGFDSARLSAVARRHLSQAPIVLVVGDRDAIERAFAAVAPERRLREIDAEGRID